MQYHIKKEPLAWASTNASRVHNAGIRSPGAQHQHRTCQQTRIKVKYTHYCTKAQIIQKIVTWQLHQLVLHQKLSHESPPDWSRTANLWFMSYKMNSVCSKRQHFLWLCMCVCVCVSGILCQTDVCYTLVHPSSWWSRSLRWSQLDGVGNHILTRKQVQKINAATNRQLKEIHQMSHKQPQLTF